MYMLILSVSALIVCEGTDEVLKASLNTKVLSLINQFWRQLHYSTLKFSSSSQYLVQLRLFLSS